MNKKKNKGFGCLGVLLATLAVLAATVVYAVLSSLLCNLIISLRFGNEIACALLPLSLTVIGVSFVLYEIIYLAKEFVVIENAQKHKRLVRIVAVACIGISLILSVVSANTYTRLGDDSISKVCFTEYKTYSWTERNDVMRFALSCDESGNISYTVTMKDGEKIELFGSVNSQSDGFKEKYGNPYGYAAYLTEQFRESEYIIDERITGEENMEKFYKEAYPEIWKHLDTIIKNKPE